MRPGQQNNNKGGGGGGMRNRNRNRKGPNPLQRSYESNGGDVKIRGTALHVAEKYVQLARDAQSSGDRVASENYLQHAEHYYRIVAAAQAQMPQPQQIYRNDDGDGDDEEGDLNGGYNNSYGGGGNPYQGNRPQQGGGGYQGNRPYQGGQPQQGGQGGQQGYNNDALPYANGNNGNNGVNGNIAGNGGEPSQGGDIGNQPQDEYRGDDNRMPGNGQGTGGQNVGSVNPNQNMGGQNGNGPNQGDRGNPRHRRRRPYRDQYQGERGGNNEPREPLAAPADPAPFDSQDGE